MALALLTSRNEPYFGEQKVYARKNPNPNSIPNPKTCPNPNPSINRQIARDGNHEPDRNLRDEFSPVDLDEASPTSAAAAAASDGFSFDRDPAVLGHRRDAGGEYVTYNISSYSMKEVRELKRRLEAELEKVRRVSSWVESRAIQLRFGHGGGQEVSSSAALPAIAGSDLLMGKTAHPATAPTMAAASPELRKLHTSIMKRCGQILTKLMRHKGGSWFNLPVDVEGMGLHDYHLVIKSPMDLGTVKSRLSKGFYPGPFEFAADIRLTFNNALAYNPKGHLVHNFADQLLKQFESSFRAVYSKYEKDRSAIERREEEQRQRSVRAPAPMIRQPMQPQPSLVQPQPPQPQQQQQPAVRSVKQPLPKPRVNEPGLREMSLEEKGRLAYAIDIMPADKKDEVVDILRKRENVTSANADAVEIDIEAIDNETLWELDQFVADWEKLNRMKKRQPETIHSLSLPPDAGNKVGKFGGCYT